VSAALRELPDEELLREACANAFSHADSKIPED
jgi:predicted HTH transcriptional regulator